MSKKEKVDSVKFYLNLLTEAFDICKQTNPLNYSSTNNILELFASNEFRFVSFNQDNLTDKLTKEIKTLSISEDSIFLPHYILTLTLNSLSLYNFNELNLDEQNFLKLLDVGEKIGECYRNKFSNEPSNIIKQSTKNLTNLLEDLDADLDGDVGSAICGHSLIEIAKALRRRDKSIFQSENDFETIYTRLIEKLESADSYIFLAAINALSELAYWRTEPYLNNLVDLFINWENRKKKVESLNELKIKENITNESVREMELIFRGKVGESIAKVAKQLGDFSAHFFDLLSDSLLPMTKNSDEIICCSALSSLADLILACRGRYFDKILHELLLCVTQIIESKTFSLLARRGAIHLLRSIIISANEQNCSIFKLFANSLTSITKQLKYYWNNDPDHVIRLHAELALIEIEGAVNNLFNEPILNVVKIK